MSNLEKSRSLIERAVAEMRSGDLPSLKHLADGAHGGHAAKRDTHGPPASRSLTNDRDPTLTPPLQEWLSRTVSSTPDGEMPTPGEVGRVSSGSSVLPTRAPALRLAKLEEAGMISLQRRRDAIGEDFRLVRHQILDRIDSISGSSEPSGPTFLSNVVAVTSARSGEGKSFASLNLAAILAEGGRRPVLLVDGDIGDASLTRTFGLERQEGLLDLGISPSQLAPALMTPTEVENLTVLPIGGGADAGARMVASARHPIRTIVEGLARTVANAVIVIDMPSCLASSDPVELAPIVSQIVLVVEAGRTRRREVEAALDRLDPCTNVNLLLNRVSPRGSGFFRGFS